MKFLDELEKKAEQQRQDQVEQAAIEEEKKASFEENLKPVMRDMFEYLKALIEKLNFVEAREPLHYQVPSYGKITATLSHDLKCLFSSNEESIEIDLTGTAEVPEQREVQLIGDKPIAAMRAFLRESGLSGEDGIHRAPNGTTIAAAYRLRGKIQINIKIKASFQKNEVLLEFFNHKSFGRKIRVLSSDQIDDQLLDKLGRCIAGVDEEFFQQNVPLKVRNQLRRQIELDKAKKELELRQQERKLKMQLEAEQERQTIGGLSEKVADKLKLLKRRKTD